MKRFMATILIFVLVFTIMMPLAACSSSGKCELCEQETNVKTVRIEGDSTDRKLCSTCESLFRSILQTN